MSTFNEKQQKAFVDDHWAWAALPTWVKAVSLGIGLPAFLAVVYLLLAGEDSKSEKFVVLFGVFAMVCVLQIIYALRAFRKLGKDG